MASPTPLRIAVMMDDVQLSDIAGVDILNSISKDMVATLASFVPAIEPFVAAAPSMTFYYLAPTLDAVSTTPGGVMLKPNTTYDDCPRDLDIVLTGGPSPTHRPAAADRFIREAWERTRVWMTVCIGSQWVASSGVLKGRRCTATRGFLDTAKQMHPDVEWLDQRWVVDEKPYVGEGGKGELWTAGGAGAGIEMVAKYALQNFDPVFVKTVVLDMLQFDPEGPKGQFYAS